MPSHTRPYDATGREYALYVVSEIWSILDYLSDEEWHAEFRRWISPVHRQWSCAMLLRFETRRRIELPH